MSTAPIQRRKLYQEVLDRLQQRIRSGELAPGDHLPSERELMDAYGVGRPAVREALQELARSGIVEITHGERARVVVPTAHLLISQVAGGARHLLQTRPDTLEHLKEARVFLEAGVARIAAARATLADVERLLLIKQLVDLLNEFMLAAHAVAIVVGSDLADVTAADIALAAHAAAPHMAAYSAKVKDLIAARAIHVLSSAE